jgi:putative ABC transport system permease protein
MLKGALLRQRGKMLMVAFTIALGASLATAMLNVMLDVGDKVNQELKTYGANISVMPRGASLLDDLYGVREGSGVSDKFLREDELGNIKTIFWAFNIVDFTPYLNADARLVFPASGSAAPALSTSAPQVKLVGAWFDRRLDLPTGESLVTGIRPMKSWWDVRGAWLTGDGAASSAVSGGNGSADASGSGGYSAVGFSAASPGSGSADASGSDGYL